MIRISINLPTKRRLDLTLVKDRKREDETPLLPPMGKVLRARAGNKLSRFFRHIFEHKRVKKLLGTNLLLTMMVMSFIPSNYVYSDGPNEDLVTSAPLVLTTEQAIRYPLDNISVTQGYKFYHPGVDYDGITGDPVYPIMSGVVLGVQYSNYAYGNAIIVDHGQNVTSLYAHLSKIYVVANQEVNTSSVIGAVGATGRSSGDHLHLEIRENGYPVNPFLILPK